TVTTQLYTLSLHDALPICIRNAPLAHHCSDFLTAAVAEIGDELDELHAESSSRERWRSLAGEQGRRQPRDDVSCLLGAVASTTRSEEHTSELQSRENLVCR